MSTWERSDGEASPLGRLSTRGLELRGGESHDLGAHGQAASPSHSESVSQKGPCAERFVSEQLPYPSDYIEATAWTATTSVLAARSENSGTRGRHKASWLATHDAVPDLAAVAPWLSSGSNTHHQQHQNKADGTDTQADATSLSPNDVQQGPEASGSPCSSSGRKKPFRRASWLAIHEAVPDFNRIQEVTSHTTSLGARRASKLDHSNCTTPKEPLSPASPGANPTYEGPMLQLRPEPTQRMEAGATPEALPASFSKELTSDRLSDFSSSPTTSGLASSVKSVSSRIVAWITGKGTGTGGHTSPTLPAKAQRASSRASTGGAGSPDNGEGSRAMRRSLTSNQAAAAGADDADFSACPSAQSTMVQRPRSRPSPEPSRLRAPDPSSPNIPAPATPTPAAHPREVRPSNQPDSHSHLRTLDQRLGSMDRRLAASGRLKLQLVTERQSDMTQTLEEHLPNQVQD